MNSFSQMFILIVLQLCFSCSEQENFIEPAAVEEISIQELQQLNKIARVEIVLDSNDRKQIINLINGETLSDIDFKPLYQLRLWLRDSSVYFMANDKYLEIGKNKFTEIDEFNISAVIDKNLPFCPEGHKDSIIPIVYGLPTMEGVKKAEAGLFKLGGCVPMLESWHCKKHNIDFRDQRSPRSSKKQKH